MKVISIETTSKFNVHVMTLLDGGCASDLYKFMREHNVGEDDSYKDLVELLNKDYVDFYREITDFENNNAFIILGPWSEECNFVGNLTAAIYHAATDISMYNGSIEDSDCAFVASFIAQEISKRISELR